MLKQREFSFLPCVSWHVPVSLLNVPNNWKKTTNSLKTEILKSENGINQQIFLLWTPNHVSCYENTWIDIIFYKDLHAPELKRSRAKTRATFIGNLLQNNSWWAEKKVEGLNASERICLPKKKKPNTKGNNKAYLEEKDPTLCWRCQWPPFNCHRWDDQRKSPIHFMTAQSEPGFKQHAVLHRLC